MKWLSLLIIACLVGLPAAQADFSVHEIRVGELASFSGPYGVLSGEGSVAAAELAVEDFGDVMGMPVKILKGDTQNKPDVASSIAQQWFDTGHVDAIIGGGATSTAAAVLQVANDRKKPLLGVGPASLDFVGKLCSPYFSQWAQNTVMLANGAAYTAKKNGGGTWFLLTADYSYGYELEEQVTKRITAAGGKVIGTVRHPLGTTDYSSFLLRAQASGAQFIGLANGGLDTDNSFRQAKEFGIDRGGQKVIPLVLYESDVQGLGQELTQGLIAVASFYGGLNEGTRNFVNRFIAKVGRAPTWTQASDYSAMFHFLRAMKAAGSDDGTKIVEQLHKLPIEDPILTNASLRVDGEVMRPVYVLQIKSPAESTGPGDLFKLIDTIPAESAWPSLAEDGCRLAK